MNRREILRYLGAATATPELERMIGQAEQIVAQAATPRHVARRFPLSVEREGVTLGGTWLPSTTLAAHLKGCQEAFLTAFTLGPGVDGMIRRYELTDMALASVLQACAAAYTEEQADKAQEEIEKYAREHGLYLRPRYSPGYGDFPLSCQQFLFDALEASKKIGVTLTANYLMLPMKSITGVVGLSPDPSLCHIGKCMVCSAENCPFRQAAEKGSTENKKEETHE